MDFTAELDGLHTIGAEASEFSRDSPASHRKFAEKHGLKVRSLSDPDFKITEAYYVWSLKKMYGQEVYGVLRSTFLIDPDWHIAQIWRSARVKRHVKAVCKEPEGSPESPDRGSSFELPKANWSYDLISFCLWSIRVKSMSRRLFLTDLALA